MRLIAKSTLVKFWNHPEYADARRLLGFLEFVNSASAEDVPPTSLLREFIGGSAFA